MAEGANALTYRSLPLRDDYPRSLALAGNTIYWTQSGKPFSAPLN